MFKDKRFLSWRRKSIDQKRKNMRKKSIELKKQNFLLKMQKKRAFHKLKNNYFFFKSNVQIILL